MPEITTCPVCALKLRVPDDLLGRKVRCSGCKLLFVAAADLSEPDPASLPGARPRPARTGARSEAFTTGRGDQGPPPRRRRDEDEEDEPRPRSPQADPHEEHDRRRRRYEDEEDEDYPRRRPRDAAAGWRGVRVGLNLAIIAGWLTIALFGVAILGAGLLLLTGVGLGGLLVTSAPEQLPGRAVSGFVGMGLGLMLFFGILGFLLLIETGLRLTGYGLCMQAPDERGSSRGLAVAAFSCAAGSLVLNLVGAGMSGFGGGVGAGPAVLLAGGGNVFGHISALLALGGYLCWLIFLRSVALQLRGRDVAGRIIAFIITSVVSAVVVFVLFVLMAIVGAVSVVGAAGARSASGAFTAMGAFLIFTVFMGGVMVFGSLALYVWYVLLVTQVRNLVDARLART
jgi:hypothetical protein